MRQSLTLFMKEKGFNAFSRVRQNANEFLFITLLHTDNAGEAENLYFSKDASNRVKPGDALSSDKYFVVKTVNGNGEERFKITDNSGVLSEEKIGEYTVIE